MTAQRYRLSPGRLTLGFLIGIIGAVLGWFGHLPAETTAQFTVPPAASATAGEFPGTRINYVGSGTFTVPAEVPPGVYILTATGNTFGCSWQRLKADDGKPKSELGSGTVNRGGFDSFTVKPTDRIVKLLGDCTLAHESNKQGER